MQYLWLKTGCNWNKHSSSRRWVRGKWQLWGLFSRMRLASALCDTFLLTASLNGHLVWVCSSHVHVLSSFSIYFQYSEAQAPQANADTIWEASLTILQLNITAAPKKPKELAEEAVSKTPDAVSNQSCWACFLFNSLFLCRGDRWAQRQGWTKLQLWSMWNAHTVFCYSKLRCLLFMTNMKATLWCLCPLLSWCHCRKEVPKVLILVMWLSSHMAVYFWLRAGDSQFQSYPCIMIPS